VWLWSKVAGDNLKQTLLNNVIAHDNFNDYAQLNTNAINEPMWVTAQVIDSGLEQKERLSQAFNKMFDQKKVGYDRNFVGGIKGEAMSRFTANAQQIIQRTLLDVERKEATELRKAAVVDLKQEAKRIFMGVQRKYQHDLPLFKALIKGEVALYKK
jgi:CRISPR system Cascade subunit CasA